MRETHTNSRAGCVCVAAAGHAGATAGATTPHTAIGTREKSKQGLCAGLQHQECWAAARCCSIEWHAQAAGATTGAGGGRPERRATPKASAGAAHQQQHQSHTSAHRLGQGLAAPTATRPDQCGRRLVRPTHSASGGLMRPAGSALSNHVHTHTHQNDALVTWAGQEAAAAGPGHTARQ